MHRWVQLKVLTVWSVLQVEKHPQPPCSGTQGSSLLTQLCPGLPAAPDQSSDPRKLVLSSSRPTQKVCAASQPAWTLVTPGCSPQHWALFPDFPTITPTSPHNPPFSHFPAGKPAFCRKLEGRVEQVSSLAGLSRQVRGQLSCVLCPLGVGVGVKMG